MTKTVMEFREHYAGLNDDTLIELAITRDLVPEAKEALYSELRKRGVHDLAKYQKLHEQDMEALEQDRQARIRRGSIPGLVWIWSLYILAALMVLSGLYSLIFDYTHHSTNGSETVIGMGAAVLVYAWVHKKISKFWVEKVLFRRQSD